MVDRAKGDLSRMGRSIEWIQARREQGYTIGRIAEELGVTQMTLHYALKDGRYNWRIERAVLELESKEAKLPHSSPLRWRDKFNGSKVLEVALRYLRWTAPLLLLVAKVLTEKVSK